MTRAQLLETDLAAQLVETLRLAWTVYQEVRHRSGRTADIVAISKEDGRSHVIECKAHAGLEVVEQASFWRGRATHSSVAVPLPADRRSRAFFCRVCIEFGIGVFDVGETVTQVERPVHDSRAVLELELRPENIGARAGTNDHAERPTASRSVAALVQEVVGKHPHGVALEDVLLTDGLPFRRDSSGVERLRRAIKKGTIPGVDLKKGGGIWYAHPAGRIFQGGSAG